MNKTNKANLLQSTVETEENAWAWRYIRKLWGHVPLSGAKRKKKDIPQGAKSRSPGNAFPKQRNCWHTPVDLVSSYHYESYRNQPLRRMSSTNQEKLPGTESHRGLVKIFSSLPGNLLWLIRIPRLIYEIFEYFVLDFLKDARIWIRFRLLYLSTYSTLSSCRY